MLPSMMGDPPPATSIPRLRFALRGRPPTGFAISGRREIDHVDGDRGGGRASQIAKPDRPETRHRIPFNRFAPHQDRFGRQADLDGNVISLARRAHLQRVNNAFHIAPSCRAARVDAVGGTTCRLVEVWPTADLPGRQDSARCGAPGATKDHQGADFPLSSREGDHRPAADLDYWALVPK